MKPSILGLITARGGSKGLPRKHVLPLAGKPLLAWTIAAARESQALDRVVLSTDDTEIANIGRTWGADVPFLRPAALAGDTAPHIPVLLHALDWLAAEANYQPEFLLLLQPTSPLRTAADIDGAVALALAKDADSVIGVSEAVPHPALMMVQDEAGQLQPFAPQPDGYQPRQARQPVFAINGAIYLVKTRVLRETQSLRGTPRTFGYVMPRERSLDIDTPLDFQIAECLLGGVPA